MTKVGLILCLAWMNNPIYGQSISRRLWRHADEILLVKIIKEERGSFSSLSIGTCLTSVTAEIVTVYKFKRIDTVRREVMFGRIFSCHTPLRSDEGLLNPKDLYIVLLDSEHPGRKANGKPNYALADHFLDVLMYTDELARILKRRQK